MSYSVGLAERLNSKVAERFPFSYFGNDVRLSDVRSAHFIQALAAQPPVAHPCSPSLPEALSCVPQQGQAPPAAGRKCGGLSPPLEPPLGTCDDKY